jgi:hypothetical protein
MISSVGQGVGMTDWFSSMTFQCPSLHRPVPTTRYPARAAGPASWRRARRRYVGLRGRVRGGWRSATSASGFAGGGGLTRSLGVRAEAAAAPAGVEPARCPRQDTTQMGTGQLIVTMMEVLT